jgi:hypothetical protein
MKKVTAREFQHHFGKLAPFYLTAFQVLRLEHMLFH